MNPFEKLALELKRLLTGYREESYYRSLCEFLEAYGGGKEYLHMLNIAATSNPNSESIGEGVGFPDVEVRQNRRLVGYIEVKSPNENLDNPAYATQFNKYKESLENVVFTNFKKWILYTWDKDGKPQKTAEADWDQEDLEAKDLKKLLTIFFEGQSYQAKTPHQLAIALARKTRLLSQQVEEALISNNPDSKLIDLKKTFEKTLIQDIGDHQFANIYAETIAYALFLAKLEHFEKGSSEEFTLRTAVDFLPNSVPIFKDLYQLTGGRVEPITPGIYKATEILIEQLNYADIEKIYKKLVEHKPGEDPVIQFYEPFLSEYDPEERKARGVYYTPKPVVDYIVRSVDFLLKTKFGKEKGLGDESVQILDPATGTGTFLMSVIQNIYADIEKENKSLGEDLVKRKFKEVVSNHILKHLYGFELLIAPYAIAHLKLTLELERLGFNFSMTEDDSDKDNDRLKIFLANTLDDPEKPPISLFGFESITEESEKARLVKKDEPILVVIGNPPYSSISTNMGDWIKNLVSEYLYIEGKRIEEKSKRNSLQNDYVKFLRFAQWKLSMVDCGIIGFITDNSYLDGRTFRGMRKNLIDCFSDLYILNLHGNIKRKEKAPDGLPDKNVFNITLGVAIVFLIKNENTKNQKEINYLDLKGSSKHYKFDWLNNHQLIDIKSKLEPKYPNYYLIPIDTSREEEWNLLTSTKDIFVTYGTGIKTNRDNFVIDFDPSPLLTRMNDFYNIGISDEEIVRKYGLKENYVWKIPKARSKFRLDPVSENKVINFNYRPFDNRILYFDDAVVFNPRKIITNQFFDNNLGFMTTGQISTGIFNHAFVTKLPADMCSLSLQTREALVCMPLYIYEKSASQLSLLGVGGGIRSRANISPEFIKEFSGKLGLEFVESGRGDLEKTFGPEDVFYYAYAVFHSPTYRTRYAEQLKIDFPRLPLTSNKELFKKLVQKGNELVNLHLLGENPFDKSETIFNDTSKWRVKAGGEKPENLDDWKVIEVRYDEKTKRVYVNPKQYFEVIEKEVWEFMIGGYQVLDKWLKDRKKAERVLSPDDTTHYMKVIVTLRETIKIMKEIDQVIPKWPIQ